jgi:hypothetical protein
VAHGPGRGGRGQLGPLHAAARRAARAAVIARPQCRPSAGAAQWQPERERQARRQERLQLPAACGEENHDTAVGGGGEAAAAAKAAQAQDKAGAGAEAEAAAAAASAGRDPGGVPFLPDPFACNNNCSDSCAFYHLCLLPVSPAATVHLSSSRLPMPLITLSVFLLSVSAVLILALLVHRLVRRRAWEVALARMRRTVARCWLARWRIKRAMRRRRRRLMAPECTTCGTYRPKGSTATTEAARCASRSFGTARRCACWPRLPPRVHRHHVNCLLSRAPIQVAAAALVAATGTATPGGEPDPDLGATARQRRPSEAVCRIVPSGGARTWWRGHGGRGRTCRSRHRRQGVATYRTAALARGCARRSELAAATEARGADRASSATSDG